MDIKIEKVPRAKKRVLARLMQLYLYDFNEFYNDDVSRYGLFEYKMLDKYWSEPNRHPFIVYVDGMIAGFVLVSAHSYLKANKGGMSIAEFFIMPKYRRKGVGKHVAFHIFDMFPGRWEVSETKKNIPAQKFWRSVIGEYTNGKYEGIFLDDGRWQGPIQSFHNSEKSNSSRNKKKTTS